MADARGPSHAVQSVPAVSGGPQVAKGRLAPVGGRGKGGERGRWMLVKEERRGCEGGTWGPHIKKEIKQRTECPLVSANE